MTKSFILVLNSGSSSIKYALFLNLRLITKGIEENIGLPTGPKNHYEALKIIFNKLRDERKIEKLSDIKIIGHRVVHGGEDFKKTVVITKEVLKKIRKLSPLAPLHNPPNILGIETCQKLLPRAKNIAVFDTEFYTSLPKESFLYALPYEFYQKHKIRRYGFHGISHKYILQETQKILKKKVNKIITCHLGAGSSITAIKNGKPIDTSMGFTPLEGLIMTTRSGSIDPFIPLYLIDTLKYSPKEVDEILNKKSGYLGICGFKDFRDVLKLQTEKSKLCYQMYLRSVVKYIGGYIGLLGGVDAIVFTAGIGEGSAKFRKDVMDNFQFLGTKIDSKKNNQSSFIISTPDSKITVLTIPTNEELMIAQEILKLLNKNI
jgi:acetate kinase